LSTNRFHNKPQNRKKLEQGEAAQVSTFSNPIRTVDANSLAMNDKEPPIDWSGTAGMSAMNVGQNSTVRCFA
jgi:hypothetical protein